MGANQGVYVEAQDGTVLVAQAANRPVHPASVSKVPTTLALLRKFGTDHRFVTTFATSGRIDHGILYGDLQVESDGDPFLLDEDALLVAERLKQYGIRRIVGKVRPRGPLMFNWQSDDAGVSLGKTLSGSAPPAAWSVVRALEASNLGSSGGVAPGIPFDQAAVAPVAPVAPVAAAGTMPRIEESGQPQSPPLGRVLIIHRSQPLLTLAKALNDYSNNIFKPFADAAGGAQAVADLARSAVPRDMRSEIFLGDGAGTDPRNRLSPRVAVKLLRALEEELVASGHALFDILPVAGVDDGTLQKRLNGPDEAGRVLGKTGTFGSYGASALIGAFRTTDHGTVYFAILNHGVPVPEARRRQDRFVRLLLTQYQTERWPYSRDDKPAIARAEVLIAPP